MGQLVGVGLVGGQAQCVEHAAHCSDARSVHVDQMVQRLGGRVGRLEDTAVLLRKVHHPHVEGALQHVTFVDGVQGDQQTTLHVAEVGFRVVDLIGAIEGRAGAGRGRVVQQDHDVGRVVGAHAVV